MTIGARLLFGASLLVPGTLPVSGTNNLKNVAGTGVVVAGTGVVRGRIGKKCRIPLSTD